MRSLERDEQILQWNSEWQTTLLEGVWSSFITQWCGQSYLTPISVSSVTKGAVFSSSSIRLPSRSNTLRPFPWLLIFQITLCCCYIFFCKDNNRWSKDVFIARRVGWEGGKLHLQIPRIALESSLLSAGTVHTESRRDFCQGCFSLLLMEQWGWGRSSGTTALQFSKGLLGTKASGVKKHQKC